MANKSFIRRFSKQTGSLLLVGVMLLGMASTAVSAEGSTETSWSPLKGVISQKPDTLNTAFKWGVQNFDSENCRVSESTGNFSAPTLKIIPGGLKALWTEVEGAADYTVVFYDADGTNIAFSNQTDGLSADFTEAVLGETYKIQVTAANAEQNVIAISDVRTYENVNYSVFDRENFYVSSKNSTTTRAWADDYPAAPCGSALKVTQSDVTDNATVQKSISLHTESNVDAVSVWIGSDTLNYLNNDYCAVPQWLFEIEIDDEKLTYNGNYAYHTIAPTDTVTPAVTARDARCRVITPTTDSYGFITGAYYLFDITILDQASREKLNNALKTGKTVTLILWIGNNKRYCIADNPDTADVNESLTWITDTDTKTALAAFEHNFYFSDIMLVSDISAWRANNGGLPEKSTGDKPLISKIYYSPAESSASGASAAGAVSAFCDTFSGTTDPVTYSSSKFEGFEYSYKLLSKTSTVTVNGSGIDVSLTPTAGMRMGFVAPATGVYSFSTSLSVTTQNVDVNYRATLEDSKSKRTVVKKTTATSEKATDWGSLTLYMQQGNTLWLEAWCDSEAVININCPLVSLTADTPYEILTYNLYDYNLQSMYGQNEAFKTFYYNNSSNPWFVKSFIINDVDNTNVIEEYNMNRVMPSDSYKMQSESLTDVHLRTLKSNTAGTYRSQIALLSQANIGISFNYKMPVDGTAKFAKFAQSFSAVNASYRYFVNGQAGEWLNDNNAGSAITIELKAGDVFTYQILRTVPSKNITYYTDPYVQITAETLLGDANDDDTFDLKDLIHLKKYCAGLMDYVSNIKAVDTDMDTIYNRAEDIAVMRTALLNGTDYPAA